MDEYLIFATRLKQLREDIGLTQKEFSEMVGFTQATLSAYENNPKNPSLNILINIATKCNVSLDWLCGISDKKSNSDEIQTYSDIIRHILKISDVITTYIINEELNPILYASGIGFEDSTMSEFLKEWNKMKDLYEQKIIDNDVYGLWIEKTLSKYEIYLSIDSVMPPDDLM